MLCLYVLLASLCSFSIFEHCAPRYAGIAVPQVLQYLREFDAPAMQSCKPLPCGIGSCQNRRLRGANPNQKTMSLWQHQGRLVYGTPNNSRPATAGTNSLRLS